MQPIKSCRVRNPMPCKENAMKSMMMVVVVAMVMAFITRCEKSNTGTGDSVVMSPENARLLEKIRTEEAKLDEKDKTILLRRKRLELIARKDYVGKREDAVDEEYVAYYRDGKLPASIAMVVPTTPTSVPTRPAATMAPAPAPHQSASVATDADELVRKARRLTRLAQDLEEGVQADEIRWGHDDYTVRCGRAKWERAAKAAEAARKTAGI